nr:putative GH32 family protein [Macrocentrus cingulum]
MLQTLIIILCLSAAITLAQTDKQSSSELQKLEKYIQDKKPQINQRYRLQYHVAGPVGWINDPNGFSYYKGEYQLFFQFYPYDSVPGKIHWGHVSSRDLINWKQLPTALLPDDEQCFSGSAVVLNNTLVLMYTGHRTLSSTIYNESQYLATSDDGLVFTKYKGNPVLPRSPNGSPDFRDPKAWRHGDHWYVILGSKNNANHGRVLLYRSEDMITWEFLRVLAESNGTLGYMWECPDFFELDGKFILLMSPQGIAAQGDRFKNLYQTGYIVGNFNYETFEFIPEVEFQELDFGHDFYAAQTNEVDGKRYVVAWFNMWEQPHPEAIDGWAGAMTIVRELKLIGNQIIMKPLDGMVSLRNKTVLQGELKVNQTINFNKTAEIIVDGDLYQKIELLIDGHDGGEKVSIRWDPNVRKVVVDRGSQDIRQVEWNPLNSLTWRIFLDSSSLELFCGEGEVVFSSRVFPTGNWRLTNLSPQILNVHAFTLKQSVPI